VCINEINRVQITVPAAREVEARRFYGSVLGLEEIPKPSSLWWHLVPLRLCGAARVPAGWSGRQLREQAPRLLRGPKPGSGASGANAGSWVVWLHRSGSSGQSGLHLFGGTGVSQRMMRRRVASSDQVTGPWGQGGDGGRALACPCHNSKTANELNERSTLVKWRKRVAILRGPCRNCNACRP
jgi:hypothetical protein